MVATCLEFAPGKRLGRKSGHAKLSGCIRPADRHADFSPARPIGRLHREALLSQLHCVALQGGPYLTAASGFSGVWERCMPHVVVRIGKGVILIVVESATLVVLCSTRCSGISTRPHLRTRINPKPVNDLEAHAMTRVIFRKLMSLLSPLMNLRRQFSRTAHRCSGKPGQGPGSPALSRALMENPCTG